MLLEISRISYHRFIIILNDFSQLGSRMKDKKLSNFSETRKFFSSLFVNFCKLYPL